jgi:hypothetical protein
MKRMAFSLSFERTVSVPSLLYRSLARARLENLLRLRSIDASNGLEGNRHGF